MQRLTLAAGLFLTLSFALVTAAGQAPEKPKQPDRKFTCIDLKDKANHKLKDQFHANAPAGNNLDCLPRGDQTLEGVKFHIGESYLRLASMRLTDKADKIEGIKVDRRFSKLHFLHATGWSTDDDTIIGEYTVNWDDDTSVTIPIVYGKDVVDWWAAEEIEPSRAKIAWKGENDASQGVGRKIRLFLTTWDNPKPDKKVKTIDYSTTKETICAPFCVAMTVEEK